MLFAKRSGVDGLGIRQRLLSTLPGFGGTYMMEKAQKASDTLLSGWLPCWWEGLIPNLRDAVGLSSSKSSYPGIWRELYPQGNLVKCDWWWSVMVKCGGRGVADCSSCDKHIWGQTQARFPWMLDMSAQLHADVRLGRWLASLHVLVARVMQKSRICWVTHCSLWCLQSSWLYNSVKVYPFQPPATPLFMLSADSSES